MKLSILFYPEERDYTELFNGKTVIVLDILRATTTIVHALAHGAKGIIPVRTIEEALSFREEGMLVGGEDNGIKPDSFDLGNSPSEYCDERIKNRWIAFRTRNGTQAIVLSAPAAQLLIGSFVNISACARKAASLNNDIVIFCSGTRGDFSLEDSAAAGLFAHILSSQYDVKLDDAGLLLANAYPLIKQNDFTLLKQSRSANRLYKMDKSNDIDECLQIDKYTIVPFVNQRIIRIHS